MHYQMWAKCHFEKLCWNFQLSVGAWKIIKNALVFHSMLQLQTKSLFIGLKMCKALFYHSSFKFECCFCQGFEKFNQMDKGIMWSYSKTLLKALNSQFQ